MRLTRLLLLLILAVSAVQGFRFGWRSDTKVFPYNVFPIPSTIDNGDNGGLVLKEVVPEQKVRPEAVKCVEVWMGNGACNRENNKAECNFDDGDCCRKSCLDNCERKKNDPDQLPC